ncbi:MAG: DUF2332 domain-containing protein [Myxococcota bacterium]|nr:DUF2332 domain-containing protein [Myxococcota bacterium]
MTEAFDRRSRTREDLAAAFVRFGKVECPPLDARIYAALCDSVARDPDLLDLAAHAPPDQPPVNLLFAAVHSLLLAGEDHELRAWYPELAPGEASSPESIGQPFRNFCLAHQARIRELIETRLTQTNVLQRTSALLPSFARVFAAGGRKPLSLLEIGASAGLNLNWDRFQYAYSDGTRWGSVSSPVVIECALREAGALAFLPGEIPVAERIGVDLNPVNLSHPDEVQWLQALIFPDHEGRQERLMAGIRIAAENPISVVEGDASEKLSSLIAEASPDATLCVFGTFTLYQFPRDALIATLKAMQAASASRPIHFISMEGTAYAATEVQWTTYADQNRTTTRLARCCPHGRWLEWLG